MRQWLFPILMASLIGLDQWVKAWTVEKIALGEVNDWLPSIVSLTYLRNYGAAYSILQHQQGLFTLITLVVMTGAVWYFIRHIQGSLWLLTGLSLIIAGGLGNFIDRLRLGYVVDMFQLEFIQFPIFNVADMCLSLGVCLLFLAILKEENYENHH